MSALPENIVPFQLPKKPRVKEQPPAADQRKVAVIPIRACSDRKLTEGMIRALILICSYCNRAGLTWVSQKTLAERLGVSQQAISKHLVKLQAAGYLEIHKRPVPGERHTTWRVIFDPSISAEDAVSITSAIEDTRPPYMKEQQMDEIPDPEGQRRIAQLIRQALKTPPQPKERTMPKSGETRTVKAIKEANQKAKARRSPSAQTQPPEVVHQAQPTAVDNSAQIQPQEGVFTTSEGCTEQKNKGYRESIYRDSVLDNLNEFQRNEIAAAGVTDAEASQALQLLLDTYQAEGIAPNPARLAAEVISLADAGRIQ